ncbi:MAG: glycosyltransferase family 2 protein [Planctomycetes bacterium]|nr:glycosyltransferase family 2 protein [Planctomycetota bacterium]
MAGVNGPEPAPARVLAVVLNYNGGADVLACLDTLRAQTWPALEVLVIDNASTDGSLAAVRARHPEAAVIANDTNRGFCAASNQGLNRAVAGGHAAALLVNDDVLLDPDCVAQLVTALERDPAVGVVGPKVLFEPERDRIWCAGGVLDYRQNLSRLRGHWQPADRFAEPGAVDYVPGCALLVRREALEAAGRLEEDYFAYLEDVEFCYRVRRAGFAVRYEPGARAYHRVSRASGDRYSPLRKYLNARNSVHFLRRHGTVRAWLAFWLFDVVTLPAAWLHQALRGRGAAVRAKARGIWRGLRGETGPPARWPAARRPPDQPA